MVKTMCTYFTGSSSLLRSASQLFRALVWHFGQCLERHELKGGGLIAALATTIPVPTERGGAQCSIGEEHAQLQLRQPGSILFDKAVAIFTNNDGAPTNAGRWKWA